MLFGPFSHQKYELKLNKPFLLYKIPSLRHFVTTTENGVKVSYTNIHTTHVHTHMHTHTCTCPGQALGPLVITLLLYLQRLLLFGFAASPCTWNSGPPFQYFLSNGLSTILLLAFFNTRL
jgi:hypothetical protein